MTILGQNLDYTDKDFDSFRARLFNLIESVFPTWSSRNVANFGNLLIELYAFVGDVVMKYQDNQARESRWSQATQRKNLIALAKLINFTPTTATASQVDALLSILAPVAGNVTIPAGTVVKTRSATRAVEFRTLANAVITAGNTSITATAENSELQQDTFTSAETPNLSVKLTATPYIDGTADVTASNGTFTQVESFLDSDSSDLHFTATVDQNDAVTIRFGNGVSGAIPTGTITVDYKTGGGSRGQVEAGSVTVIDGVFTDSFATPVKVSVTNPSPSTPATDRQSVASIRERAPEQARVNNRTVSREDYEINARRLSQVARALMVTRNEDPAIGENTGFLFIVPVGGGLPTQQLKDDVLEMVTVTYPNTLTFVVTVSNPLYKTIDVYARIALEKGADPAVVDSTIRANLVAWFAPLNDDGSKNENVDFGYAFVEEEGSDHGLIPLSTIMNIVRDSEGVRKIGDTIADFTLNGAYSDLSLNIREFPILGTVTLINSSTNLALVE
jgi:hypothetical protein